MVERAAGLDEGGWLRAIRERGAVSAALLIGGAANGFAARVAEAWAAAGIAEVAGAVSPFELVALGVAATLLLARSERAPSKAVPGWPEALVLGLLLVPSSAMAWLASGAYALLHAMRVSGRPRAGACLVLALAAVSLWSSLGMPRLAVAITPLEAKLVATLLGLIRGDIVQVANVVGVPQGHSLVILAACSAFDALPRVVLGTAAVALLLGPVAPRRLFVWAGVCGCLVVVACEVRLLLMAWSSDVYAVVHGPAGANVFDLILTAFALAAGSMAVRR